MILWYKRWAAVVAAIALLLGLLVAGIATGHADAEKAVLIPGATVFKAINPLYGQLARDFYPIIGEHFHNDDDPRLVDYSQNALAADRAIRDGVQQVQIALQQTDGKVVVIGESMGSMVAARVAAKLADSPDPPSLADIRFVLIASPEVGIARYFKEGTYIPILNYRISRVPQSPYQTTIVIGEYDGWADPPDRPWNLLASANALMGMAFVHGPPIAAAVPENVPAANITQDDNVTTLLVPTRNLPLTQVFREIGVSDALVDKADRVLRPIIDAGYRRHDKPGDTRRYLYDGKIQRPAQGQGQLRALLQDHREKRREVVQQRREHRSAIRNELRDRVEAGVGQLTKRLTERRAQLAQSPE